MKIIQRYMLALFLILTPFLGLVTRVQAEEVLSVTDNGSGSTSQVQATQSNSTAVEQNNTAQVQNDIAINGNTGGNTANDNNGGATDITTGDASVTSSVTTSMNASAVSDSCCQAGGGSSSQATISGNGEGSANSLSYTSTFNSNAGVTNTATISNNINGTATTGNNKANGNSGNVSITTGNISVVEQIINKGNKSYVFFGNPNKGVDALITGNGTGSQNTLQYDNSNSVVVAVNNQANIFNNSFWELVTGDNEANDNSGDVTIATGDIHFEESIINDVNHSEVVVTCCKKEEDKPTPSIPPEKPVSPKPNQNSNGGGGAGGSSSNGDSDSAIENVLPVTGNLWFYMALAANIAMLIFGTFLRLRSGRSPSLAIA